MDRCKAQSEQRKKDKIVREIMQKEKGDYYSILGLPTDCSSDDVKRAYKKLSLKVHPDKNKSPDAAEVFKIVLEAYQCLKKAKKSAKESNQKPDSQSGQTESPESRSGQTESPESRSGQTESPESRSGQTESPESRSGRTEFPKYWARRQCEMCGDNIFGTDARLCIYCEEEVQWCRPG